MFKKNQKNIWLFFLLIIFGACNPTVNSFDAWIAPSSSEKESLNFVGSYAIIPTKQNIIPLRQPTPTPDNPKTLPTLRNEETYYIIQAGDTLAKIALAHQVSISQIIINNKILNPNLIEIGQELIIPPSSANDVAPASKIIPDSELVFSPSTVNFNIETEIVRRGGFLSSYKANIENQDLSGVEIIRRISQFYSVNPRLLIALIDYQSGWVSQSKISLNLEENPLNFSNSSLKGLFDQLSWAANELNRGFYAWMANDLAVWTLSDGSVFRIDPTINAGTASIQYFFSLLYPKSEWLSSISESGFYSTYLRLFGDPFLYSIEPLLPANLVQPELILPFMVGDIWSYTSGPHGGWNSGSAWAALDFAPPGEALGCFPSSVPVSAVAQGLIVRSGEGAVVQDLDGDGFEQTGWTILYMHIATDGKVEIGKYLYSGDPVGYASCEGGFSSGTHLHIARRYNGVWIAADDAVPFVLDGWTASSAGIEYDGYLEKDGLSIEAWYGRSDYNQISR